MARARNVRVLNVDIGPIVAGVFAPLRSVPLSGRAQIRTTVMMREAIRIALHRAIKDAFKDGASPMRAGRSKRIMENGVRVFGTTFISLRGHIIGPNYIAAHNKGATIVPTSAKALAIPLPKALRKDGSPKLRSPRSWKMMGSFIYKSKNTGRGYIAYKDKGGKLVLLYVLVQSVELKKHKGFLDRAWHKQLPFLTAELGAALLLELSGVNLLKKARIVPHGGYT